MATIAVRQDLARHRLLEVATIRLLLDSASQRVLGVAPLAERLASATHRVLELAEVPRIENATRPHVMAMCGRVGEVAGKTPSLQVDYRPTHRTCVVDVRRPPTTVMKKRCICCIWSNIACCIRSLERKCFMQRLRCNKNNASRARKVSSLVSELHPELQISVARTPPKRFPIQ